MACEYVDVGALREACIKEQLLKCERRFRALRGVLQHDRVAKNQVRHGEASNLVVRVVPRHDAEDHSRALVAEEGLQAVFDLEFFVCEPLLGIIGECRRDSTGELGLADGLLKGLAHLAIDDCTELVLTLNEQLSETLGQRRALGDCRLA